MDEIVHQLRAEAERSGNIFLVSPLQLRLIHLGPGIYLHDDPRIAFIDIDMHATDARQQLGDLAAQRPLYMALDAEEIVAFDMEIENLIRYTEPAVGLKPSARQGKARLRGLHRIIYSRTVCTCSRHTIIAGDRRSAVQHGLKTVAVLQ